jgi:hypothetical protein
MRARPVMSCLFLATQVTWVWIAGCIGKGAGPATGTGRAGGDSAGSPPTGVAAGGAFGSGGVDSNDAPAAGGVAGGAATALGSAGTGGISAGGAGGGTGGTSGLGGAAQGGAAGTDTVIECAGTTCAARDDGGTDGVSGECGEPVTKACYAACRESTDEASCSERGGTWRTKASGTGETCVCPTGEGGRPCTASSDCLGDCSAWMDPMQGNGTWCQQNVTSFTCSAEGGKQGCWCRPEVPFAVCYP